MYYRFYKIKESKVISCLDVIRNLVSGDKKSTQIIKTTFELIAENLYVEYHYRFFYDIPVKQKNLNIVPTEMKLLFEGIIFGRYVWNDQEKKFLPNFNEDFTPETLDWLEGKSMNNPFFQKELKRVEISGTKEQKKLLKQYLKDYKKD